MPTGAGWPLAGSRSSILILSKGQRYELEKAISNAN